MCTDENWGQNRTNLYPVVAPYLFVIDIMVLYRFCHLYTSLTSAVPERIFQIKVTSFNIISLNEGRSFTTFSRQKRPAHPKKFMPGWWKKLINVYLSTLRMPFNQFLYFKLVYPASPLLTLNYDLAVCWCVTFIDVSNNNCGIVLVGVNHTQLLHLKRIWQFTNSTFLRQKESSILGQDEKCCVHMEGLKAGNMTTENGFKQSGNCSIGYEIFHYVNLRFWLLERNELLSSV